MPPNRPKSGLYCLPTGCPMKSLCLLLALMLLSLSTSLAAQRSGGGGGTGGAGGGAGIGHPGSGSTSVGNIPPTGFPSNNNNLPARNPTDVMFFVSGKVVVDDGTAFTDSASLQTNCKGQLRTIGHTDLQGFFTLQFGGLQPDLNSDSDLTDTVSATPGRANGQSSDATDWHACELQALAPGFTSQVVELASHLNDDSSVNIGNIVLHRMAQVQGFTISATSAAAPHKASKDYEKGLSLEKKSAWAAAQKKFQSAVDLYPKYAVAWVELGRMQMKQDLDSDARQSFEKAVAADPKFVPPYKQLIALAVKRENWQELADSSGQLLSLDPVSFPQYWFFNSAANYNVRNFDLAEKSARKGLQIDVEHRWPRLEYLLGLTLARKRDYHGAVQHLRIYLQLAPRDAPAELAQNQLKQLEALLQPEAQVAKPE
jgi:tetratricopeptide (TPR) repeat protein